MVDPNETLRQLRSLADRILTDDSDPDTHNAVRLAELIAALDAWLTSGGFPPARWTEARWPQ